MPTPLLTLDTVDQSSIVLTGNAQQEVARGFIIEGLDTSVDPSFLTSTALSVAGMPTMGSPHPAFPNALLGRLEIQGILPDAVSGRLVYTTLQGVTPTAYVLTRSTRLVQETSNILPDGTPIAAKYTSDAASTIPYDYIPMTFMRPCTVLTAEGVRLGPPNYPGAEYVGYVNENGWGGRPKGHWLIAEFTTAWSKYDGYHQFRCSVQAFINGKDWSTFGILRSSITGKYAYYSGMDSDIQSAVADPYEYGEIGSHANGDGFIHVGGYPTIDFGSIGL